MGGAGVYGNWKLAKLRARWLGGAIRWVNDEQRTLLELKELHWTGLEAVQRGCSLYRP